MKEQFSNLRGGGVAREVVTFVKVRSVGEGRYTFPTDVARHLGCDWVTAEILLLLGCERGYLGRRSDGRWYYQRRCVVCDCTEQRACLGGCSWVGLSNVCTSCQAKVWDPQ